MPNKGLKPLVKAFSACTRIFSAYIVYRKCQEILRVFISGDINCLIPRCSVERLSHDTRRAVVNDKAPPHRAPRYEAVHVK